MDNIMSLKNVTKEYDGFSLKDISFSLKKGYIMGFIGPNGAGKTTTIKLIMNLLQRDSGNINIFGLDNVKNERDIKKDIGFIYSDNIFWDELSIKETSTFISRLYTNWDEKLFRSYIDRFNLPISKKIKKLSKGMQMKVSIAMALSHNPKLLIMDEPTSGLDPVFRRELLDILLEIIQDEEKSIFFSTHITSDLEKTADYITFLNSGKMVFSEDMESVMEKYKIVKGPNELLESSFNRMELLTGLKKNKFGFEGITTNPSKIRELWNDRTVIENASLDDIMFYTARSDKND